MHRSARAVRRELIKGLALLPLALLASPARAARTAPRRISFYHTHTGERLKATYFEGGRYLPDALRAIDHLLRDFRTGQVHAIDRRLLDQLAALDACCGGGTFEVISGYRSSATNELLRETTSGVAAHSLHLAGRAIDVRLSGFDTAKLRAAAIAARRGGVGFYPRSDFVHLDTGRYRTWGPRTA
ncbi:MAG TPA: DUF882 domain-containing protein [Burkholderiales bacterium]|nr:DUF882 domain-containing protein [Burkholderiales bacterium]